MKAIVLMGAGLAGALFLPQGADAAAPASLWPTRDDSAICAPIFSKLRQMEEGTLVAQAQIPPPSEKAKAETKKPPNEEELTTELSAMLQACSYDGKALTVRPQPQQSPDSAEGKATVDRIMRFTGLPQNFTIMESDVPNAAAIIVLGEDRIPRRVIAYSRAFMREVAQATGEDGWPGTSILAHEIGHHLSGHTLMPGGSQPPTELEADKFSGFVLFKMGASLPQARKAIATLIPLADGPTHPGQAKRLKALQAGWMESCRQQQQDCGEETVAVASVEPSRPALPKAPPQEAPPGSAATGQGAAPANVTSTPMPDIPGPLDIVIPGAGSGAAKPGPAVLDQIPRLQAEATPSKFDRFVYDDVGVFDPAVREKLQETAYQFAAAANVEVVTVVTKDLQERDPDQFALDFMRQMRVGKMDVGNGAVLVVAPNQKKVGLSLGPGLRVLFENDPSPRKRLADFLKIVEGGGQPQRVSSTIAGAAYRVMSQAKSLDWVIRYPDFAAYQAADEKMFEQRAKATTPYDPARDPVENKLLRLDATLMTTAPDPTDRTLMVNEPRSRHVGPAMQVRTPDGKDIVLYVNRDLETLMPVPLQEGRRYSFVARDTVLRTGAPQLDLISYDLLQ
ncbi:TPM domain-containing protein [Rhizobium sp. SSA_523]|uniref:TPM domain-containing protein n=1 Tax=Rhizobium sp. SSA_523 TaxID=2952477 RepID=UPI002091BD18|nr:TPM domain-containing protein [Rhizobium sp. SSA_523]MCO5731344.1 TPM domain-containing protein [Rhizobium sp. SSA_523]WKC22126.1 TPM domain-containing protein [Rhizobium sp. SSA_523]